MKKEDIENIVSNIILGIMDNKEYIDYGAILLEEGIDSLKIIEIVVKIEETFDLEFEDEKLSYETLRTISSIAEYVYLRTRRED